jgi:hypothetical protein
MPLTFLKNRSGGPAVNGPGRMASLQDTVNTVGKRSTYMSGLTFFGAPKTRNHISLGQRPISANLSQIGKYQNVVLRPEGPKLNRPGRQAGIYQRKYEHRRCGTVFVPALRASAAKSKWHWARRLAFPVKKRRSMSEIM